MGREVRTTPYLWRLTVAAAVSWTKQAMRNAEMRMEEIRDDPAHIKEFYEARNAWFAMKAALEKLENT